jgi:hypothetical protein
MRYILRKLIHVLKEAGKMILEDYEGFTKHAKMMTGVHAVPKNIGGKMEEKEEVVLKREGVPLQEGSQVVKKKKKVRRL